MRYMRSFFIGALGIFALVVALSTPSAAFERQLGVYALDSAPTPYLLPDFINPADQVAELRGEPGLGAATPTVESALGPIYALSLRTDGQSLPRHYLRC